MIAFPFAASRGEGNKRWQQVCPMGHGGSTVGAGRKDECLQRVNVQRGQTLLLLNLLQDMLRQTLV